MALSLPKRITDLLVTKGVISKEDLQKAQEMYAEKGGKISDILIKSGSISKDDLMTTISEELGLPLLDLSRLHVDPAVLKLIPQRIIRSYSVVPVSRIGNLLTVAMVDPLN
ncbi:MAG: type II secretion system protein GspE, partial [Candidatus Omnitrophota bacterium]